MIVSDPERSVEILGKAFPSLIRSENRLMIQLRARDRDAIDLFKPAAHPLFQAALDDIEVLKIDDFPVVLPTVEATLALKFASYRSVDRSMADRYQDVHDLMLVSALNPNLDRNKARMFGDMVCSKGGTQLLRDIADARAERRIDFSRGL